MKPIRHSFSVAEKVRKAIQRLNPSTELQQRANFAMFDNCREQGYVLQVHGVGFKQLNIAFTENRNSDDIVVYCYKEVQFPSNLPAQGEWSDRKYFNPGQYDAAADYILARAIKHLTP